MYYKHSGRFGIDGLLIAAATGVSAALVLAYAYGRGIISINEVHFAFLATAAFGGLMGAATGYGLIWGKVRNNVAGHALTATISTLALYVSWAVWVKFTMGDEADAEWMNLAQHPSALWKLVCLINEHGTWTLDHEGSATTGLELWGIWAVEAACVIGIAIGTSMAVLNRHPYCESCGTWGVRGAKMALGAPPDVGQLKLQLQANNWTALENLGPSRKDGDHLIVALDSCERCRRFHTMSATHVMIGQRKFGGPVMQKKQIVEHLVVGPSHVDTIRKLADKMAQALDIGARAKAMAAAKK